MTKRILLAGLAGGVAMFIWASIAHMALPLGRAGISEIPNDQAVLDAMRSSLGASSGLYLFPGMGSNPSMQQYEKKLQANPSGLLIYHPPGQPLLTPGRLITEFVTELLEALLLTWLMAQTRLVSLGSRLGFAFAVAIVASITTNISYWNWYGFPSAYTFPYMFVEIAGFLLAGLIAARLLPRAPST